eukprot:jgi/Botrbrau1/6693/Bobra.0202s0031.1
MMEVTDDQVKERLIQLLADVDLDNTSEKQLRKTLEEEFNVSLYDRKAFIRSEVQSYLDALADKKAKESPDTKPDGDEEEEQLSEDSEPRPAKKKKRGGGGGFGNAVLSEPLAAFVGVPTMARTQVVKAIWAYIKENNLQDPKNKQKIIVDEKLATFLKAPVTMFSMNKQLSKHIGGGPAKQRVADEEDDGDDDEDEDGSDFEAPKKRKAKPRSKQTGDGERSANGGFKKKLPVSKELEAWIGKSEISRPELTSFFWQYVKEHGLQNPSNKKEILCDEVLEKLTGEKKFAGFGFAKFMKPHLDPQDQD